MQTSLNDGRGRVRTMSHEFSPTTPIISYNSSDMIEEVVGVNLTDLSLMTLGVKTRPRESRLNNVESF